MMHSDVAVQQSSTIRPATMRRKSSAQNLLTNFRSSPIAPTAPGPSLSQGYVTVPIQQNGIGVQTPATATMPRDWDSQSLQSESIASSTTAHTQNSSPAIGQGTTVEYLRDTITKRMITLTYIRNVHEGRSHWFHTILMTKGDLERVFSNVQMKKRTYRFAILGMSLSNLFDIQNAQDLLRALSGTLTDYDQSKDENYKPKIRFPRLSKVPKRGNPAANDYNLSYTDGSDASYLMTPHMPFPLDYREVLLSLLDVLSEIYNKLSKILGPSPFPHSGQQMMGSLGLISPHPGVSYLFQGAEAHSANESEGSLWGIANGSYFNHAHAHGHAGPNGALLSPPPQFTPALGEMILKVDGKFKKIVSTLLKELDAFARNSIKDELASLDPLLRNIAVPEDGREQYDFEGVV